MEDSIKSCNTCRYERINSNEYPCSNCTRNAIDRWRIKKTNEEKFIEIFGISIQEAYRKLNEWKGERYDY